MFTGIIEKTCRIVRIRTTEEGLSLEVDLDELSKGVRNGDSIAINGVCLTVTAQHGPAARFDAVRETLNRSTLGSLRVGDRVNVERSLKMGDRLEGHFVMGHVDGVATVESISKKGESAEISVSVPEHLMPFVAEKGSVALDGVSLTVAVLKANGFTIALVPFTVKNTTLGDKKVGDRLNIEVDALARYVARMLHVGGGGGTSLEAKLLEGGFL